MTAELKPCPFCGRTVAIERGEKACAIVCIAPSACHGSGLLVGFSPEDEAEAIAAWNIRADLAPALAVPEVAALVEAAKGLAQVLNEHEGKGPLPDVALMMCWLAAQNVRAAMRALEAEGQP